MRYTVYKIAFLIICIIFKVAMKHFSSLVALLYIDHIYIEQKCKKIDKSNKIVRCVSKYSHILSH